MKICEKLFYGLSYSEDLNTIKLSFFNNINFIDESFVKKYNNNKQFNSNINYFTIIHLYLLKYIKKKIKSKNMRFNI